ncbi:MAG: protein kinase [Actinomycetota bacterium]|nr:protein kinase [Actinomycetota bacterium]
MSSQISERVIADRYSLDSPLGRGGMGVVWRAEDTLLGRGVAVKEVELPHAVAPEERESIRKRVMREARAAARLNHPNAVTVYDVVEAEGKAFIVMELIRGRTLADVVKEDGPLAPKETAEIGLAVLDALEAAHAEGIVHRDVKPANVMIPPGSHVKLADFGIASVKDDPKITATGLILGSPSYMAPEQANHGRSGPEADLWGLGSTLYFAVEGVPPFDKSGAIPTLTAVLGDEPREMQRAGDLAPVIEALLEKDPERRAAAAATKRMLQAVAGIRGTARTTPITAPRPTATDRPIAATPPIPLRESAPSRSTVATDRKWIVALVALVAVAIAAILIVPGLLEDDGPTRPENRGQDRGAAAAPDADTDPGAEAPVEGLTPYEDPSLGYTLSYPSDWTVEVRDAQNTFFKDPDGGTYLQVAWAQPPTAETPEEAWERQEPSFDAGHNNYQRIGIFETTFKGMDAAAWEFTYDEGGTDLHAVNFGFITTDQSTGMTLFFQTRAEDWDSSQELLEQLKAGFEPPG